MADKFGYYSGFLVNLSRLISGEIINTKNIKLTYDLDETVYEVIHKTNSEITAMSILQQIANDNKGADIIDNFA